MNVIEISNLSKSYKKLKAVNNISLSIKQGEIFGMLGPNGAGKTTTIECVTGLKDYDSGSVHIHGIDVKKELQKVYEIIGLQLQETIYQDKIKVSEICQLFHNAYKNPIPYIDLIQRFGLEFKLNSYVQKLSGGQRQKLSIILALIGNPKLVFLDELTTGLDPEARRDMWAIIKGLRDEGRTVFMTTHYMEEAEYLCDRICLINNGELIACDNVQSIISQSGIESEITFISKNNDLKQSIVESGISSNVIYNALNNTYTIYSAEDKCIARTALLLESMGIDYSKLSIKRSTLDDAFIKLTGGNCKNE